jgi:hypothetical protein
MRQRNLWGKMQDEKLEMSGVERAVNPAPCHLSRGSRKTAWHGHLARDSSRHFLENRAFFTGKMPVPGLKTSISQLPSQ